MIIYGSELSLSIKAKLKEEIAKLEGRKPNLSVILVGDNKASLSYIKSKSKAASEIGMGFDLYQLDKDVEAKELEDLIKKLNDKSDVDGILLQLPISEHLDQNYFLNLIDPSKDVDGLNELNVGRFYKGEKAFIPCTPLGIMALIKEAKSDIKGLNAVVLGRSNLVGLPVAKLLLNENATVTICHSKTKDLKEITKKADIIVSAMGQAKMIDDTYVSEGQIVIDVGTNHIDGKLCGDVDFDKVKDIVAYITPVPKGVGPMTIAMLLSNVWRAYCDREL